MGGFKDRIGRLIDKFCNLKLKVKLHARIDELLRLELNGEDLVLDPDLQDKAFDLATEEVSDRMAAMFAKELVKQLKVVMERDGLGRNEREGRSGRLKGRARKEARARDPASRNRPANEGNRMGATDNSGRNHAGAGAGQAYPSDDPGSVPAAPAHEDPEPEFLFNASEIHDHLSDFISKLGPFEFDQDEIQRIAAKVETDGDAIRKMLDLEPDDIKGLAAISLYDIVFLCDDSGSMKIGDRIPALIKTLQSVSAWATLLEPTGIALRFLNYSGDMNGGFDNLKSQEKIADMVYNIPLGKFTKLGTMLQEKVLQYRAGRGKPLIVVIITDGEPDQEDEDCLRDSIVDCKTRLEEQGKQAGMIFIIFQVGRSKEAQIFLNNLGDDEEVNDLVYRSSQKVDDVIRNLEGPIGNVRSDTGKDYKKYKRYLLREFIGAVMGQVSRV